MRGPIGSVSSADDHLGGVADHRVAISGGGPDGGFDRFAVEDGEGDDGPAADLGRGLADQSEEGGEGPFVLERAERRDGGFGDEPVRMFGDVDQPPNGGPVAAFPVGRGDRFDDPGVGVAAGGVEGRRGDVPLDGRQRLDGGGSDAGVGIVAGEGGERLGEVDASGARGGGETSNVRIGVVEMGLGVMDEIGEPVAQVHG